MSDEQEEVWNSLQVLQVSLIQTSELSIWISYFCFSTDKSCGQSASVSVAAGLSALIGSSTATFDLWSLTVMAMLLLKAVKQLREAGSVIGDYQTKLNPSSSLDQVSL